MLITARQYGEMMRREQILWPAPAIDVKDLRQPGIQIFKIGQRSLENVFVFSRRNWATVYVHPDYTGYRDAFDMVMPRDSTGRDVDHLLPKSKAARGDFRALGRIGLLSNRGWNDETSDQAMAQKVYNMSKMSPHSYTSQLTDMERGWAVVTCYIRPLRDLAQMHLKMQSAVDIEKTFKSGRF